MIPACIIVKFLIRPLVGRKGKQTAVLCASKACSLQWCRKDPFKVKAIIVALDNDWPILSQYLIGHTRFFLKAFSPFSIIALMIESKPLGLVISQKVSQACPNWRCDLLTET